MDIITHVADKKKHKKPRVAKKKKKIYQDFLRNP
jgi:hypothetical protein